jgi:transcriptional regulator with XRE-family HTH domain
MENTPTDGGRRLRTYLDKHGLTVPKFCESSGLNRVQVHRLITGERGENISARLALAIDRATDGEVPVTAWDDAALEGVPVSKVAGE